MEQNQNRLEVVLITYNHENDIKTTLRGIEEQDVPFPVTVKVYDDFSTDGTLQVIKEFAETSRHNFQFPKTEKNLGIYANYARALKSVDHDYFATLEGDDYWADATHLSSALATFKKVPSAMGYSSSMIGYYSDQNSYVRCHPHDHEIISAPLLATSNMTGNFSCCVYNKKVLPLILDDFIEIQGYDWLFNLLVSDKGLFYYNHDSFVIYQIHQNGLWSRMKEQQKLEELLQSIEKYDQHFKSRYAAEFTVYRKIIQKRLYLLKMKSILPIGMLKKILSGMQFLVPTFVFSFIGFVLPPRLSGKFGYLIHGGMK